MQTKLNYEMGHKGTQATNRTIQNRPSLAYGTLSEQCLGEWVGSGVGASTSPAHTIHYTQMNQEVFPCWSWCLSPERQLPNSQLPQQVPLIYF